MVVVGPTLYQSAIQIGVLSSMVEPKGQELIVLEVPMMKMPLNIRGDPCQNQA
jgi:hypothetical protein